MLSKKTSSPKRLKKPHPDFPLTPHPNGYWVKKIGGKQHRFGERWCDPKAALNEYLDVKDDLLAGRPVATGDGLTIEEAINKFLDDRHDRLQDGEIVQITFEDYQRTCRRIVEGLGRKTDVESLRPQDFARLRRKLTAELGATSTGNQVQRIRTCFKYLYEAGEIENPVRFGPSFKKPSARRVLEERNKKAARDFSAKEIRDLLDAAHTTNLRAMILLGVNCGFGNRDCASLPEEAVDLGKGWVEHARRKTGVMRRCPLWAETIDALRDVHHEKADAKEQGAEDLVFLTRQGFPYDRRQFSSIAQEFRKITEQAGCYRSGVGFYALRHVFETIGGNSKDQVAVDHIMGHKRNDMASVYRTRVEDDRLLAVTDHIHAWLFDEKPKPR